MIPTSFIALEEFPLTPNGKIDRQKLPSAVNSLQYPEYEMPRSEVEGVIAQTWQEALKVETVGIYDNFFEVGGHSLLVIQVIAALKEKLEVNISIRDFFENATIAGLAAIAQAELDQTGLADLLDQIEGMSDEEVRRLLDC